MILRARLATAAALAAAAVLTGGCGATIYDAQGVPKLACTATLPLACGFSCLPASAERDAQCGAQCLDCTNGGANALSSDAAAANFCNVNDPDVALHACDFRCDATPGLVKNLVTNRCDCADP